MRFAHQYDTYGNWTQQSATFPSHPSAPPAVRNRTLRYY